MSVPRRISALRKWKRTQPRVQKVNDTETNFSFPRAMAFKARVMLSYIKQITLPRALPLPLPPFLFPPRRNSSM